MLDRPLAFVDLETTGTNPVHDRIIEIGILLVDADGSRQEWSSLVDPGTGIPPFIESLTGISPDMVKSAPSFGDIADEVQDLLGDRLFVAHNARFDYSFLRNEFQRRGVRFHRQPLCTVKLSRKLFPAQSRHNLDAVVRAHGLPRPTERHRALDDARVLADFLEHCCTTLEREHVDAAIAQLLKRTSIPKQLDEAEVNRLPEAPGVYRFYDDKGTLLYIGKSVNIRSRVLSHFSSDHSSGKEMTLAQQVRHIGFTETAGELGALLLESREIKEQLPIMNRRQRRHDKLFALHMDDDPAARPMVEIITLSPDAFSMEGLLFGPYRSRRALENDLHALATEHGFCPRLLGLEKASARERGRPCFARQLKRCRGACEGAETDLQHWLRLQEALESWRFARWPFDGAIGIRETAADGRKELHLLDNWCWLESISADGLGDDPAGTQAELFGPDGLPEALARRREGSFDLDTYKILKRYLLGRKPKLKAEQVVKFPPR
ncbi:MAG: exonuclease domain-containing protein [Gammaproteobacteria bacterium]|nr:exonuclease domain-containing protein [Gammaproteobacteria bacterium]